MNIQIKKFSRRGEYHAQSDQQNQDVVCKRENAQFAVAVVADGVSTCSFAREGAEIACRVAADFFMRDAEYLFDFSEEKVAYLFIELIRFHLARVAADAGQSLADFSSTLLLCGLDKKNHRLLAVNLGDGAIIIERNEQSDIVLPPRRFARGCCTTTTANAYLSAQTVFAATDDVSRICIFSDGALDKLCGSDETARCALSKYLPEDTESIRTLMKNTQGFDDSSFAIIALS